jgi:hypothetical protein
VLGSDWNAVCSTPPRRGVDEEEAEPVAGVPLFESVDADFELPELPPHDASPIAAVATTAAHPSLRTLPLMSLSCRLSTKRVVSEPLTTVKQLVGFVDQ